MSETNGCSFRGGDGRFLPGNPGGPGNPHGRRTAELRAALLESVSVDDVRAITAKLVELAKAGDIDAAKLILDRVLGKPVSPVEIAGFTPPSERVAEPVDDDKAIDELWGMLERQTSPHVGNGRANHV